jgi:hypothetical protein
LAILKAFALTSSGVETAAKMKICKWSPLNADFSEKKYSFCFPLAFY